MKLTDITPAPWNARNITPESVKELAESIDTMGLISPVTLWQSADGDWLCIAGNRRLAALKSLHSDGWDGELPKDHYIVFGGDESEARAITITENLQREDLGILDEASAVTALLDLGASAKTVAAKLGKSVSWVNRRRKLANLDEAWKDRAAEMDADALEKIAAYPAEIQQKAAKNARGNSWRDISWTFERESRDLDVAKFNTKPCRECLKRTGVEADLFGVCDGYLGKCQDCKCFDAKLEAWAEAEIAKLAKGAEVVRIDYSWQAPGDTTEKRDKAHPCAYVCATATGVDVLWGESAKAKKEREAAEQKKRDAEREAERAETEREDAITDRLDAWKNSATGDEYPAGLAGAIAKHLHDDYVIDTVANAVMSWHAGDDWATIIEALPEICECAGVSAEDREYLIGRYAEKNETENE